MTRIINLPYPPLITISIGQEVCWKEILPSIENRLSQGVSLCFVREAGKPNHGGYFFHIRRISTGIEFLTFDRRAVCVLEENDCERFINHVMGFQYDESMWELCQTINLRTDDYTS